MTAKPKKKPGTTAVPIKRKPANRSSDGEVQAVLAWLKQNGTKAARDGMARFAIPSDRAFGISVGALRQQARRLGQNHALAAALWKTGWYEARMLAIFIAEPDRVTPAQMDRWVQDFDNWAICDTACFHLFDRTADPWRKVEQWSGRREEFVRRAGFALMWSLSVHDKQAGDEPFVAGLALIEGRIDRRTELRQEGCQHGAPRDRQTKSITQWSSGDCRPAFGRIIRPHGAVDWKRRAQRAHEPCRRSTTGSPSGRKEKQIAIRLRDAANQVWDEPEGCYLTPTRSSRAASRLRRKRRG
jgi:hypothetical protein